MTSSRPTLIFVRGHVVTQDLETTEATALALAGDKVLSLGSDADILSLRSPQTRIVDLHGRALLPGLADAHLHLVYYGLLSTWLDLTPASTVGHILSAVRDAAAERPPGSWIYGRGWRSEDLVERRPPTRAELDAIAPRNPILLSRQDGHLCIANSLALGEAGIASDTPSPPGGTIGRNEHGELTGELSESAIYLAWNRMMETLSVEDLARAARHASQEAARYGLTSAHCIVLENVPQEMEAMYRLDEEGQLPLQCYLVPPLDSLDSLPPRLLTQRSGRVHVGGAKIFADGTLTGRTAALRQPYSGQPANRGHLNYPVEELRRLVEQAKSFRLQPLVHAVGDAAVEACLDAFESVFGAEIAQWRPRIEHAAVLAPDLVERMARLGVVASIQPRMRRPLEDHLGPERAAWSASLRPLLRAGVPVAAGSDAPFIRSELSPLKAISTLVQETDLSLEEAWRVYTQGSAFAAFAETETGTLRPGFRADMVVLEADPRSLPPAELGDLSVDMTICAGEVTWEAPGAF